MADKHTPEPWVVITGHRSKPYLASTTRCDDLHWNGSHHDLGAMYFESDMKRAAACVNALRGIDNPEAWVKRARNAMERSATLLSAMSSRLARTQSMSVYPVELLTEIEELLKTPGPKEGAHEQDARGDQSPP